MSKWQLLSERNLGLLMREAPRLGVLSHKGCSAGCLREFTWTLSHIKLYDMVLHFCLCFWNPSHSNTYMLASSFYPFGTKCSIMPDSIWCDWCELQPSTSTRPSSGQGLVWKLKPQEPSVLTVVFLWAHTKAQPKGYFIKTGRAQNPLTRGRHHTMLHCSNCHLIHQSL